MKDCGWMLALAADTSLPVLSVAIVSDAGLVGCVAMQGHGSRNEKLLPAIDWLLAENGIDRRQIDLFAVTRGPGSFTGVRIGLATLQGLALALDRPLCAMSTHEAVGLARPRDIRTAIIDDAGRGELYASIFDGGSEIVAPRLVTAVDRDALLAGADVIALSRFAQDENVAACCARRAIELEVSGRGGAYRDVTPIYVRLAEAEVKLQQKNG
ncbi:MAG: tRNA (adenosine(37)-N6)-threonylcarbamoyltransferase complex dimerization subunit type 1 TsaB [Thermoanaerobaculia bacterium]